MKRKIVTRMKHPADLGKMRVMRRLTTMMMKKTRVTTALKVMMMRWRFTRNSSVL
jgi:hypothetical protein